MVCYVILSIAPRQASLLACLKAEVTSKPLQMLISSMPVVGHRIGSTQPHVHRVFNSSRVASLVYIFHLACMAISRSCWCCAWCHPEKVVWLAEPSGRFASATKVAAVMACYSQICTGLSVQQMAGFVMMHARLPLLDIARMQMHAGVAHCVAWYCTAYVDDHGSVTLQSPYNKSTIHTCVGIPNHALDNLRHKPQCVLSVHT